MSTRVVHERPILCQPRMAQGAHDGWKTMTRRLVKPQPPTDAGAIEVGRYSPLRIDKDGQAFPGAETFGAWCEDWDCPCPYGQPGDRLWVRERLELDEDGWVYAGGGDPVKIESDEAVDWAESRPALKSHCQSIHMPRWACRTILEIVAVRVERVGDISEEDAVAEGFNGYRTDDPHRDVEPRDEFFRTFYDINNRADRGANPWVWVIEFRKVTPTERNGR